MPHPTTQLVQFLENTGDSLTMIVQSQLSDAEIESGANPTMAKIRIGFVKHLINIFNGNLNHRINATKQFAQYADYYSIKFDK